MSKTMEFKNVELVTIANTLGEFKLKGKASLGRTRLISKLADKNEEYNDDRIEIQKRYFQVDEKGNLKTDENKKLIFKEGADVEQGNKEMLDLGKEMAVLDFTEYSTKMTALLKGLEDYEYELSGKEATVFATVYDQLEKYFGTEEENK